MTEVMRCSDLMADCPYEARGETNGEIIKQAAAHAKEAHGLEPTPELAAMVQSVIREEQSPTSEHKA